MLRFRMVGMLVVAVALLAAACGEEAPEVSTDGGTPVQEEGSAPDASSGDTEPSSGESVAPVDEDRFGGS